MLRKSKPLIFIFLFFLSLFSFSQTKEDLKRQKAIIEEDIKNTTELLNKTKKNKETSLNYLKALEKKIKSQERLLQNLNIEIKLINREITTIELQILENQSAISSEEQHLSSLKREYSKMIYSTFIKKGNRNDLIFIISAEDFNQAFKRLQYIKQYTFSRKNQVKKILQSQEYLKEKESELGIKKKELIKELSLKNKLTFSKEEKIKTINRSKKEKQELVKSLGKSEKLFKRKIQEKHKKNKALEDKIRKIIEEEIRKAKAKHNENEHALTPEALILSEEFVSNKGNLPWPLSKGVIVQYYGKQTHPVFPAVHTFNNGIDIATDKNTKVRTVFDGVVSRIFFIKGSGKAVLINHGEYFSVYSGLEDVYVKTGDKVLSKENIGTVIFQENEEKTELHFEIWKGYEKQDPSTWLFNAY